MTLSIEGTFVLSHKAQYQRIGGSGIYLRRVPPASGKDSAHSSAKEKEPLSEPVLALDRPCLPCLDG